MVIEILMLSSTFILAIVLVLLLFSVSKEKKPKRRFKVKEDLQRIKEQINN